MFHHLCLSNFAEKERKEKIRETERKDKGNIERVMIQCSKSAFSNLGIFMPYFCARFESIVYIETWRERKWQWREKVM